MIEIRLEVVGVFRAAVSYPRASARLPAECGLFLWCRMLSPIVRPIVGPIVRRLTDIARALGRIVQPGDYLLDESGNYLTDESGNRITG